MKFFNQINHVKKLIDSGFFDDVSNTLKNSYDRRTIVRKIRRKYRKLKILIKRRCIQRKIKIKNNVMKTLLNSENEINLINKVMTKRLKLSFFIINEKTCDIINIKLNIFEIHFLIIVVIDKNDHRRYFEEFFLKININENIILDML